MKPIILKRITNKHGDVYLELSKIVLDNGVTEYQLTENYPGWSELILQPEWHIHSKKEAIKAFYDSYEDAIEDCLIEDSEVIIYKFQKYLND